MSVSRQILHGTESPVGTGFIPSNDLSIVHLFLACNTSQIHQRYILRCPKRNTQLPQPLAVCNRRAIRAQMQLGLQVQRQ